MYRDWYYNRSRKDGTARHAIKLRKKWTTRMVVQQQHKKGINQYLQDEYHCKSGDPTWIAHYQEAVKYVMDGLTREELKDAEVKAQEWNKGTVDVEVQQVIAQSRSNDMARHFASEMFHQAGMRVFVLTARYDAKEGVSIGR
jgi:hypothetical protein